MEGKLFTNIASHYRKKLWARLLKNSTFNMEFCFGQEKALGIKSINLKEEPFLSNQNKLHKLKNIWVKKILIWQRDVIKLCLTESFDKGIFLGEAYCLSTWFAAIICRLRSIEVIFWGHGLYGNEGTLKLLFRKTFYHLADKHLLYERRAKKLMVKQGFDENKLYVAFNSLDYDKQKKLRENYQDIDKRKVFTNLANAGLPILIFIGRLTPEKHIDHLIRAVNRINHENFNVNLIIIGDGPEREKLEVLASKGIKKNWINFLGACYEEEKIARYLSAADLCVSPGNVGLTAIHCLSYGTPVATHKDFSFQMPEAGAIKDGYNGFFFKKDNTDNLIDKIKEWFKDDTQPDKLKEQCYEVVDKYYNPNYQVSVFERIISDKKPEI